MQTFYNQVLFLITFIFLDYFNENILRSENSPYYSNLESRYKSDENIEKDEEDKENL